jgi:arylsulfatase A-like enzyme
VSVEQGTLNRDDLTRPASLPPSAILSAATCLGLAGGYVELLAIILKKDVFHAALYYEQGRHFWWVVPAANLVVMLALGLLLTAINRLRPGLVSLRAAVWLFATLAFLAPLLRAPFYTAASLLVSAGVARLVSRFLAERERAFIRAARLGSVSLLLVAGTTGVVSVARQALAKSRSLEQLPAPPARADNLLLIVMDTVRASSMGLYGYDRDTTPQLARWAKRGVKFDWAVAPAPWTFPSHCSFLTGQLPSTLGAHWQPTLRPDFPTLAEFLASRGYLTAGFAANTFWCSYESHMDRGFVHYEDHLFTPRSALGSIALGRWMLENLGSPRDYSRIKWLRSQSQDASGINRSFLDWLPQARAQGRPFFVFLNYLDAHEPFLLPPGQGTHFGRRPESRGDYNMLLDYWDRDKLKLSERERELARDCYDDCIAALDRQIGALLDQLERRGVLRNTVVVITSDHGEQFGEHGAFNHGFSPYLEELHVPLLILSRAAPNGATIAEPVSLRDLPATVSDLLALQPATSFGGRSLAQAWRASAGAKPGTSPAFSEVDIPNVIPPERGRGPAQRGFTVSLVAERLHHILDIHGTEELFDVAVDPGERRNLARDSSWQPTLNRLRTTIAQVLAENAPSADAAVVFRKRLRTLLQSLLPPPAI